MAKALSFTSSTLRATICFLLLVITLKCAYSARILEEVDPQPQQSTPVATTAFPTTLPGGQFPATAPANMVEDDKDNADHPPLPEEAEAPTEVTPPATVANPGKETPPLSFFMHDILGGSHPSSRVVTGIIAQTEINGIPFSKANSNIFPVNGGTPLFNPNYLDDIINQNNVPFLTGLNGAQPNTVLQNTGNNNVFNSENGQPFVSAGQLPPGSSLQKLMFGTVTVFDDELTEGQELGSGVVGRAQGFYLASSLDGTSQTIALTVLLHSGEHDHEYDDSISFFGVHRTASHESQIAVVGGTGKYENAKGYATVETLHQEDQHTTDGVDTIVKFSVYLFL
ncbi:dirigent protein 9-like [Mangifera indica]|uniref:dirigent protein 9-like n=1 Tax=Mangifera indica TaxID=29780 RepID=UPI001CFAD9EA|nr:dirigent protein 9-like [Mangifera indica]